MVDQAAEDVPLLGDLVESLAELDQHPAVMGGSQPAGRSIRHDMVCLASG